jgi:hypothetical protein
MSNRHVFLASHGFSAEMLNVKTLSLGTFCRLICQST